MRKPILAFDGGVMAIDVDPSGKTLIAAMTDGTLPRMPLARWK